MTGTGNRSLSHGRTLTATRMSSRSDHPPTMSVGTSGLVNTLGSAFACPQESHVGWVLKSINDVSRATPVAVADESSTGNFR